VLGRANRVTNRVDFLAAAAALLGVLLLDTLPGLVIGIGVSLVLLIAHTSRPHVAVLVPVTHGSDDNQGRVWVDASRNPDLPASPGVVVVRVEAPLLFANADFVRERVRELVSSTEGVRLVVLDGEATPSIDVTASAMLVQLRTDLRRSGVELVLAEDVGQVRDVLVQAEPEGLPPVYVTIEDALGAGPPPS
jgi:MFS superfamily sulfate permease-like transporter